MSVIAVPLKDFLYYMYRKEKDQMKKELQPCTAIRGSLSYSTWHSVKLTICKTDIRTNILVD